MRADFEIITPWVKQHAKVLDLGCGNGRLLSHLQDKKNVCGYGIENDADNISECIRAGVNVIEQDLDKGLSNFADQSFDVVIMTLALQAVKAPDKMLDEMLRIGREAIVTFPNFAHWRCRLYLGFKGKMPVSETLPYTWYNTPNIHLSTFADLEELCEAKNVNIMRRNVVDYDNEITLLNRIWPNLFGEVAIYHLTRK